MISKWYHLKEKAISIRKSGKSIVNIEATLGIPRSTLSGWFKKIKLTKSQYKSLKKNSDRALIKARARALIWHNAQKRGRLDFAEREADKTISLLSDNQEITELALALLYLGEGFKTTKTGMGNSDPLILKFFLTIMRNIYRVDIEKIRFELHLRADQNPEDMIKYWSKELNAPLNRFKNVSIDKRTAGSPTYPYYKGVCIVDCGTVAIQRKLIYIGRKFCEKVIKELRD